MPAVLPVLARMIDIFSFIYLGSLYLPRGGLLAEPFGPGATLEFFGFLGKDLFPVELPKPFAVPDVVM
jgi:hypothetical protein